MLKKEIGVKINVKLTGAVMSGSKMTSTNEAGIKKTTPSKLSPAPKIIVQKWMTPVDCAKLTRPKTDRAPNDRTPKPRHQIIYKWLQRWIINNLIISTGNTELACSGINKFNKHAVVIQGLQVLGLIHLISSGNTELACSGINNLITNGNTELACSEVNDLISNGNTELACSEVNELNKQW